jgi:hypothetical protein
LPSPSLSSISKLISPWDSNILIQCLLQPQTFPEEGNFNVCCNTRTASTHDTAKPWIL